MSAPFHKGEMVRFGRRVMQVTNHTLAVSAYCGCGRHHYELASPKGRSVVADACGAKLSAVVTRKGKTCRYPGVTSLCEEIARGAREVAA